MKCKHIEKIAILYLYDDLSPEKKLELEKHLKFCQSCAKQVEERRMLLKTISLGEKRASDPRWDHYWRQINLQMDRVDTKSWTARPSLKWSFTLAGFAFFLILGFLLGRLIFTDSQMQLREFAVNGKYPSQSVLVHYFEDMKPLILDLCNASLTNGDRQDLIEKEVIESMLIQTRLLQHRFSQRDPYVAGLLTDIEMILTEVSNRVPGDRNMARSVRELIKERGIPIKIDLFEQRVRKI